MGVFTTCAVVGVGRAVFGIRQDVVNFTPPGGDLAPGDEASAVPVGRRGGSKTSPSEPKRLQHNDYSRTTPGGCSDGGCSDWDCSDGGLRVRDLLAGRQRLSH